jgi:ubiquitin
MWETILKRNIKPNATLSEVEIKIRQALKVSALEDVISVNEDKAQRLVNTDKRKERQELLQKIKQDKETLQSYKKSNPFVAFGNKKSIQINDAGEIIDDGYGRNEFYPVYAVESKKDKTTKRPGMGSDSGKKIIDPKTPLTIEEAALHYKENIVDYDEANINRVMPDNKPYDAPYGRRKEPTSTPSKLKRDLEEAKDRLNYYENIIEDKRTPADKRMLVNLRMEVEELQSQMIEDEQEESRVEYEAAQQNMSIKPSLPQIRTILQPISNVNFDDFVIALDKFIDTGSAPIIDAYKEENPEKFAEIMALVDTTSTTTSVDEDRYLDKLLMMVNKKSIDFNRSASNNRVSLQVTEKDGYKKEPNRLILPVNEDLSNRFGEISQWLGKHYEPVPEVKDGNLFIQKLVRGINETVDDKGGNNSIAYAIQHMINNNLADRFSNQIVVTGRYLDANTEQQKFREFISTQARRNMKLLENIATFLHRGKQMTSFLTEDQMNQANEMLQQQVGSKPFGRYFLAEIPSAQLQRKPKSGLATRLGAKGRKKTGESIVVGEQEPPKQRKQGPSNKLPKQTKPNLYPKEPKYKVPVGTKLDYPKDYEPMPGIYSGELTENQKEVLADIRQSYKINIPPSTKTIEENKKKLEQTRAEAEEMSPEEKESNLQEWVDRLVEIALKNKGKTDYEPYTARKRTLMLGRMVGEENNEKFELYTQAELREKILENVEDGGEPFSGLYVKSGSVSKADLSDLSAKERRKVKTMLQNAHPTEYFGEDYLRLGKVINIIDGLAEDEEAELLEKLGVKNLQMVKTAASLRKKYENLYKKLYDMVYDEEE